MSTPAFNSSIRRRPALGWLLVLGLAFWLLPGRAPAASPSLQEYSVKAALLFNIAKYTDWPQSAFPQRNSPLIIGVLGNDPFGDVLDRVVKDRRIQGRPIVIRRASGIAPLRGAHLVFISATQPQAAQDSAALERWGALTVGDSAVTAGHTAINFLVEGDSVVFTVDLERTARVETRISSQLLKFAQSVKRPTSRLSR